MPAEGLDWLPNDEVLTDDEVVRLITIARRAARRPRGPVHRRRAAAAPRAPRHRPSYDGPVAAARDVDHDQRAGPDPHRAGARRGRARPGQRQPRHRAPRGLPHHHPPGPVRRRRRRAGGSARPRGSARSRSTPCCCAASTTTRHRSCCSWCMERGYQLRFIEQMPLDAQHRLEPRGNGHRRGDLRLAARACSRLEPAEEPRGSAPAELFTVDGGPHTVGVIASVTRPFCGDCDRVRLTADGQVRNCLFAREESDLRPRCAAAPTTPRSPTAGGPRCSPSVPVTASTTSSFLQPAARCPPSAASTRRSA